MRLEKLFSPSSVAIIGASTRRGSVGWSVTENILSGGFSGKIYPVNPKAETLFELPCYKRVGDIPGDVDLAIIIIPAASVPDALREAGAKGIPAAIIISSGFKETGEEGARLEREIVSIAESFRIALLGPNCLGYSRPEIGLNASFAKKMPAAGPVAFFSQSGALCTAVLDLAEGSFGFSTFVSTGNKAVIEEGTLLRAFAKDDSTRVIGFYAESLSDAPALIETGRALLSRSTPKPIIALKSGISEAGTRASGSHTGALAGSDSSYAALFRQARILRAGTLEELFEYFSVFSGNHLPEGRRLAIITNAGGLGVLATDAAVGCGLRLAEFSSDTATALKEALPPAASVKNPIDVLGDALADRFELALRKASADPETDMLLVIVTPQTMTQAKETAQAIVDCRKATSKPVAAVFAGRESLSEGSRILKEGGVPSFLYPESAARALGALAQVAAWRDASQRTAFLQGETSTEEARAIIAGARREGRRALSEAEARRLLMSYGFAFPQSVTAPDRESAVRMAQDFDQPFVMKIVSPDIVHKSDVGGVLLGVRPERAGESYDQLVQSVQAKAPEARIEGVLLMETAKKGGHEVILGLHEEPGLGKVVMLGMGGIYVETWKDVSFRFVPLCQEDAHEMMLELKGYPILNGTRGEAGINKESLIEAIGRLSRLALDFPEIRDLDINPLLCVSGDGAFQVLDARISLSDEE